MTNKEWLDYLAHNMPDELAAWFDAEHAESTTSATMQHIGQVIEDTVKRGVYGDTAAQDEDSREQLEADVRKIADAYNMDTQRHGTERFAHELYYSIIHLLDRQAAITDAEWESEQAYINGGYKEWIADLEAQIRELTAERESYREKFGKCIDYADAIHALMDEGLA